MPWFWGSNTKNDDDDDDDDYEDDGYDDEEDYSSSGSYEDVEEDDEEEDSFESEEEDDDDEDNEDEGDGHQKETSTKNNDDNGGDSPATSHPKETKVDDDEGDEGDDEDDVDDDDYVMPLKPEPSSTAEEATTTTTTTASNGVGNPADRGDAMNRTERSIESISIGNEDLSLIDSDHMHSEDYLNIEDGETTDDGEHKDDNDDVFTSDDDDHSHSHSDDDDDDDDDDSTDEEEEDDSTDDELEVEDEDENEEIQTNNIADGDGEAVKVSTIDNDEDSDDDDSSDDDNDKEEEEEVTSFWEKQNLLILAAEHDRVDILKAILTDEDDDRDLLMREGIPPLHISISFGSTNATQSLLRMGADPSIRPNIADIKRKQQQQQQSSSSSNDKGGGGGGKGVEIPNMQRFDGISAWELAFGNKKYEESLANSPRSSSWSLFGKSSSTLGDASSTTTTDSNNDRIIKPVDMAPSKREGIRHAFTAESLRCIGGDEVIRLGQLLDSGMPPTIDIGGKDLYGWAVEMGAMKCEELLRPTEAAKHEHDDDGNCKAEEEEGAVTVGGGASGREPLKPATAAEDNNIKNHAENGGRTSFRILDRHGQQEDGKESIPSLINRLDELESLASALSTCLDNLAEEVSVCHGLLLMGGGATALAAHVKSLKTLQYQKSQRLVEAQEEWEDSEQELAQLIMKAGEIGKQVPPNLGVKTLFSRTESFWKKQKDGGNASDDDNDGDDDAERCQLKAQIAASENKIRKLRTSIADLSDENTKEMEEVEKRGLSGGINLVRTLREEIRDTDYQLSETKSHMASCRAKISWIHSQSTSWAAAASDRQQEQQQEPSSKNKQEEVPTTTKSKESSSSSNSKIGITDEDDEVTTHASAPTPITAESTEESPPEQPPSITDQKSTEYNNQEKKIPKADDTDDDSIEPVLQEMLEGKLGTKKNQTESARDGPTTTTSTTIDRSSTRDDADTSQSGEEVDSSPPSSSPTATSPSLQVQKKFPEKDCGGKKNLSKTSTTTTTPSTSERIATGDSQALAVRPETGSRGYLTVDLWQVLLRIIGFNRAATRRGVEVAQTQPKAANLMIV